MESSRIIIYTSFFLILSISAGTSANCPNNLTNATQYIKDSKDCRTYWICNNNVQKKMTCPINQCFNPELNECTSERDTECDPNDSTEKLFPDCDNCTMYFQCSNGRKVHQKCPKNLWFNFVEKRCDYVRNYPEFNGCGDIRCTEGPDRKQYPVDDDTKKFVWCISGRAYLYICCKEDERCYFDEATQSCVLYKNNYIRKDSYISNKVSDDPIPSFCRSAPIHLVPKGQYLNENTLNRKIA